jgi:hypothetical protein
MKIWQGENALSRRAAEEVAPPHEMCGLSTHSFGQVGLTRSGATVDFLRTKPHVFEALICRVELGRVLPGTTPASSFKGPSMSQHSRLMLQSAFVVRSHIEQYRKTMLWMNSAERSVKGQLQP